ncbi:MAG: VWA domain-containing protein [Planctomycetia bacterium]|nr:VWA domain-containing protein [Planctomycetia bacterium]
MGIDSLTAHASSDTAPLTEELAVEERPIVGRGIVWSIAAGGSSMVVHLALLLILGLIVNVAPPLCPHACPFAVMEDLPDPIEIIEKLTESIVPATQITTTGPDSLPRHLDHYGNNNPRLLSAGPKLNSAEQPQRSATTPIEVGVNNIYAMSRDAFVQTVPFGTPGSTQSAPSYTDAMDRMTQEILNKLAKSKVLLVWVFDQSESMQDDRAEITARIDRVYVELGLSAAVKNDALLTAVTSYGANVAMHTPQPTSNTEQIMAAIQAVPNDPSGEEKMCRAVTFSIDQHQRLAQQQNRQLMCILVTDESGDQTSNFSDLERTIETATVAKCPIYVLGREAVFGYPYAHIRWTDPETKYGCWIRIDRGPESPFPEQLQVDGFQRRYDAHPSGFGPYEQSRMARQTGGVFFMLPSPEANLVRREVRDYDPDSLRTYMPDLSSREAYAAERDKHPLRAMLWKVITDLNPYDKQREALIQVRLHGWPIERAAYAHEAEANIKKATTLIQYFAQAQQALEGVAHQRDRDPSIRWRANFDVAYAQTLAYQARLHDYIAYVGAFVRNPKAIKNELGESRQTNAWNAAFVQRTLANDPQTTALRERSALLYRKIVQDHAGTPWGARAEYELTRPFGIEFRESHEDPRGKSVKVPHQ